MSGKIGTDRQRDEGNTVSSSRASPQPTRRKYYCGSLFGYEEIGIEVIENRLRAICNRYQFGQEVCPTTGNKHLQMFLVLKKASRITELRIPGNPHLEPCRGDEASNLTYTSKEGKVTRWGFPKPIKIITELRPWQQKVVDLIETEPDDRTVYWFWEHTGNFGKSALVKYLIVKYGCLFCQGGRETDIMNLVFNQDMDACDTVLFNITRAHKGNVSYASLENIKDGLVCNTKYECGFKVFNAPHVICFANFPPTRPDQLSKDRWVIECLHPEDLLLPQFAEYGET